MSTPTAPTTQQPESSRPRERGGNAVGVAAFLCGALALGPLAIALGLVGLARYRSGKASRRSWPLAGLILGVIGTLALAVGAYLYATSDADQEAAAAHAKVDVINVGNAVVDHYAAHPKEPVEFEVTDAGYRVSGLAVSASDPTIPSRALSQEGSDAYDWCITVTFTGDGLDPALASFAATEGYVASCPAP